MRTEKFAEFKVGMRSLKLRWLYVVLVIVLRQDLKIKLKVLARS